MLLTWCGNRRQNRRLKKLFKDIGSEDKGRERAAVGGECGVQGGFFEGFVLFLLLFLRGKKEGSSPLRLKSLQSFEMIPGRIQ